MVREPKTPDDLVRLYIRSFGKCPAFGMPAKTNGLPRMCPLLREAAQLLGWAVEIPFDCPLHKSGQCYLEDWVLDLALRVAEKEGDLEQILEAR